MSCLARTSTLPRPVGPTLAGRTLGESAIGARTGLSVIALQNGAEMIKTPPPSAPITEGSSLVMLGTQAQRRDFFKLFSAPDKNS